MESLAYLVVFMLLVMVGSSITSGVIGWRARSSRARLVAFILGLPGLYLGFLLLFRVDSIGAVVFGVAGMTGFALTVYRWVRELRA